ncbi:MAG: hypothetical protein R3A44_14175 [Caldilineaceae bacterium]
MGNPNENGDIEAQNGALKRAVKQQLLLRGSREFADIDAYETFLFGVMEKRNRGRQARGRRDGGDEAGHGHGLSDQQRAEGARESQQPH